MFDELLLVAVLLMPGCDSQFHDSQGEPYLTEPWATLVDSLSDEVHARLAKVARGRGYCPAHWLSPAEVVRRGGGVNNDRGQPRGKMAAVGFMNCVRAYYWGGHLPGLEKIVRLP